MFSASDVANFLACHHQLTLDCAEAAARLRAWRHAPSANRFIG